MPIRYAFLTPEFPTTRQGGGGLSTYVARMARLLSGESHDVEVFVLVPDEGSSFEREGYRVTHVHHQRPRVADMTDRVLRNFGQPGLAARRAMRAGAIVMATAVENGHGRKPFDVVQSPDFQAVGVSLPNRAGRLHVVRCSAAMDLYMECDGRSGAADRAHVALEDEAVRKADIVIAPSRLVADHYARKHRRQVHVVRPPAFLEVEPLPQPPLWLPPRFLLHFAAYLCRRKGTELLVQALPLALRRQPDLVVVCIGKIGAPSLGRALERHASNVLLAHTLSKPALYATIRAAAASVLPSIVDNLPNTAIESKLLGTRLIATYGSSLDEIADPDAGDLLVDRTDANALADAMVAAWRRPAAAHPYDWLESDVGKPFRPENALAAHLAAIASEPPSARVEPGLMSCRTQSSSSP